MSINKETKFMETDFRLKYMKLSRRNEDSTMDIMYKY